MQYLCRIAIIFLAAMTLFFSACSNTATSAGGFHLGFVWPESGKPDFAAEKYYAFAVLQEWPEGDQAKARTLGEAGPVLLDATGQGQISFKEITYGSNRVIRVEIRKSDNTQDRPLYFGISNTFKISAGSITEVQIAMQLQETPGTDTGNGEAGSFAVDIYTSGAHTDRVGSPIVTLHFTIKNGDVVVASNKLDLLETYLQNPAKELTGVTSKKVSELTLIKEGEYEISGWDLNTGREAGEQALDGERIVYAKLLNNMGYQSETKQAKAVLDRQGPQPINVSIDPAKAKLGDKVKIRFSFDEPVDSKTVSVNYDGLGFTDITKDGAAVFEYEYTIQETDTEREYSFTATAMDLVGNAVKEANKALGTITIDRTKPALTSKTASVKDDKAAIMAGDTVAAQFTASEELDAMTARIDGNSLTCTKNGLDYDCSYTVKANDVSGIKTITISIKDLAGNEAAESISTTAHGDNIVFDLNAPSVMNAAVAPGFVKTGDEVVLSVSFGESVRPESAGARAGTADMSIDTAQTKDNREFVFKHTVTQDELEGSIPVSVTATDIAGNILDWKNISSYVVDRTPIEVTSLSVNTNGKEQLKESDPFSVEFTVSEDIDNAVIQIGAYQMTASACTKTLNSYSCAHSVTKAEGDGSKQVTIEVVDKAGNVTRKEDEGGAAVLVIYDMTAPILVNKIVSPDGTPGLAALGSTITVIFTVSEESNVDLYMSMGGLSLNEIRSGQTYTYTHTVSETDPDSGEYDFSVTLIDKAGNSSGSLPLGNVKIDRIGPTVTAKSVSSTNVKLGQEYSVTLEFSKELKETPQVMVGSRSISDGCVKDAVAATEKWVCTHTALEEEGDGVKQINVEMKDKAGNTSSSTLKNGAAFVTIEYDVTPPDVVNPVIAPEQANLDSTIDVRFSFTEDVVGDPAITIENGSNVIDLTSMFTRFADNLGNQRLFIYKHKVTSGDTQGTYTVKVTSAVDKAGNPISGTITIGSFKIDSTPPVISSSEVSINLDSSKILAKEGDTIQIKFKANDEISDKKVRIGLILIPDTNCSYDQALDEYTCVYTAAKTDGEGSKDITVELKDLAGNAGTGFIKTISYDMTDPALANALILPAKVNKASGKVEVKLSFTEDVKLTAIQSGLALGGAQCALNGSYGKDYICEYAFNVADTSVADYPVTVTAIDRAGNSATALSAGTISVDREIPHLTAQSVGPVSLKLGTPFTIAFTASEELGSDPIVKVGTLQLGAYATKNGNSYTYTHSAASGEGDGSKIITVTLTDPSGNSASIDFTNTVTYDTTPPIILNPTVSPETANSQTAAIDVRFSFPEDVTAVTCKGTLTAGDGPALIDFACDPAPQLKAKTYKCTYTMSGTWKEGRYDLKVNGKDEAGNFVNPADEINGQLLSVSAVIDRAKPELSAQTLTQCTDTNCSLTKTKVKTDDTVRAVFTVSETLRDEPIVKISGQLMTKTAQNSLTYTYEYTVRQSDGDGQKPVTVEMVDPAGNTNTAEFTVKADFDVTAPTVLNPIVTPQNANAASTIQVSFSFSETIDIANMSVKSSDGTITYNCGTTDSKKYTCTHAVAAGDGTGYSIVANGTDTAGNILTNSSLGSFTIDRIAPTLSATSVSLYASNGTTPKTVVKKDDVVKAVFTASETLAQNPTVRIGGQPMSFASKAGLVYTYTYTVQQTDGDGDKQVAVDITDESGNASTVTLAQTAAFDVTAPTVLNPIITPLKANATSTIRVSFSFSETIDIANMSVKSADGTITYSCGTTDSKLYTCTHAVAAGDGTGYTIVANGTDTAGNSLSTSTLGSFTIDRVAPTLSATSVSLYASNGTTPKTVVKKDDVVKAIFTASETLAQNPTVRIGGQPMSFVSKSGLIYTYTYTVQQTDGDGDKQVAVDITDESGNASTVTLAQTAAFDVTAPTVLNPVITPLKANASSTVTATFSFSETIAIGNMSVKSADGTITYSCSTGDSKKYTCTHAVAAGDGTGYTIVANGTDTAGNSLSGSSLGSFTIDRVAPTLSATSVSLYASNGTTPKTVVKKDDVVKAIFTASETLAQNPTVRIGGQPMSFVSKSGLIYTYTYTVQQTDGDGDKQVAVDITDESGNASTVTLAQTAAFDVTAPTVLNPVITPLKANASSTVTATFSFSETIAIGNMSVKSADGTITYSCSTSDSKLYTCTHAVAVGDGAGYSIVASGTDTAGNILTNSSLGSFAIDRVAPTLSATSVSLYASNGTTPKTVVKKDDVVKAVFTASETLAQNPTVRIGGQPMSFVSKAGLIYTYTYTVQQTDGDGDKQVAVDITDESGNASTVTLAQTAAFDVTAPTVLNPIITPLKANATSTIRVSFSFSETIAIGNMSVKSADGTITYSCGTTDSKLYTCTHAVAAGDGTGYTIVANGTDTAGNSISSSSLGSFAIDRVAPLLATTPAPVIGLYLADGLTLKPNQSAAKVKAGEVVKISFTTVDTQMPGVDPEVRVGGKTMTKASQTGNAYVFKYTVVQTDGDGDKTITVDMQDEYTNTNSVTPGTAAFDVTAPTLINPVVMPQFAKETDTIKLNFTISEPIVLAATITSGDLSFDCSSSDNKTYLCTHAIKPADAEGLHTFTITLTDTAGNISADLSIGSATIDRIAPAPVITAVELTTNSGVVLSDGLNAVADGHSISFKVTFTIAEPMGTTPKLEIGSVQLVPVNCMGGVEPNKFCYEHTVAAAEGEGYKFINLITEDRAGNTTLTHWSNWVVVYDFTGPRLVSALLDRSPSFASSRDNSAGIQSFSIRDPLTNALVSVSLTLYADEPVDPARTITLNGYSLGLGTPTVNFDEVYYNKTLSDADIEGLYTLTVTWSDKLGNTVTQGGIYKMRIDKTATNATDINMNLVRFIRIPYGSESTVGLPRYKLSGEAGAITNSQITNLTAYTLSGSFAGQTTVNTDGSFLMPNMSSGNVETVYLNPIRKTGASMMPVSGLVPDVNLLAVKKTRYIATMGYKVAGSDLNNPNNWLVSPTTSNHVLTAGVGGTEPVNGDAVARQNGIGEGVSTSARWNDVTFENIRSNVEAFGLCYDAARGRPVFFGGRTGPYDVYDKLFEFYEGKWHQIIPNDPEGDGDPGQITRGAMAYDARRGTCVYYGGWSLSTLAVNDHMWEWNGTSWKRIYPTDPEGDGNAPDQESHIMVYDLHRGVMVTTGGDYGYNDVWEFNGESWRYINQPSGAPGSTEMSAAYDSSRRVIMAVDGGKTWEYVGGVWRQVCGTSTSCTMPADNYGAKIAYHQATKRMIMFGGRTADYSGTYSNVTYYWTGTAWSALSISSSEQPSARYKAGLINYDAHGTIMLVGGQNASGFLPDTWEFDGTSKWTRLTAADIGGVEVPPNYDEAAYAFDQYRGVGILHGGVETTVRNETWEWNGYAWRKLAPAFSPSRKGHVMVYDPNRQKIIMFGGHDGTNYKNDLYEWTGTNWVAVTTANTPVALYDPAMTYDSVRQRMVVFGGKNSAGNYVSYTYELNTTLATPSWTYRTSTGPSARTNHDMAYDPVNQKVVLFGGFSGDTDMRGEGDTWEWNGTSWNKRITGQWTWVDMSQCDYNKYGCWKNNSGLEHPQPRWGAIVEYDPDLGRIIMSGGISFVDWSEGYTQYLNDTWEYNSATGTWKRMDIANDDMYEYITKRREANAGYDTVKKELFITGGRYMYFGTSCPKDMILRSGGAEKPSEQFDVPLYSVGLERTSAWKNITSISLNIIANGTGHSGASCAVTAGAKLYGWALGRWMLLDAHPTKSGAFGQMTFEIDKPDQFEQMIYGEDAKLSFKIELGSNAGCRNTSAPLSVDYAEITVDMQQNAVIDRYYVSTSTATWANARTACAARGMDLAVITSQEEADIINSLITTSQYYWIGLSEPSIDGTWKWVNGQPAWNGSTTGYGSTWNNWAKNTDGTLFKPSDTGNLNCGLLYYYPDKWIWWDWGCGNSTYYICEKRNYTNPGITGTKAALSDNCIASGGNLLSVNSEFEEDNAWPLLTTASTHLWIGLTNTTEDGIHIWPDGEVCWNGNSGANGDAYGFTHWYPNQPDYDTEDCTVSHQSIYSWFDVPCDSTYGGICEF